MTASCIAGVELASRDPEELADFYVSALGFTREWRNRGAVCLRLSTGRVWLLRVVTGGRAMPVDSRSNHHWFRHIAIVVRDMPRAHQQLLTHNPTCISDAPETLPQWNSKSAGIEAFYFRDPEGHALKLLHFPRDKGRSEWHAPGNDLFQGIDHTAIVVSNAPKSLQFYRRRAAMIPVAEVTNHGDEQERLTQVAAVNMHVVSLAAESGMRLELLHYVEPHTGRPMPQNTCQTDLWWSRTVMQLGGNRQTPPLRDPDGHETLFQ